VPHGAGSVIPWASGVARRAAAKYLTQDGSRVGFPADDNKNCRDSLQVGSNPRVPAGHKKHIYMFLIGLSDLAHELHLFLRRVSQFF
jgi:hypothetical protein